MKLLAAPVHRLLDAVDLVFDAISSVMRVLIRGRFEPDSRTYRSSRFFSLGSDDVFLQDVALNAADSEQARRVIRLDPERYLPLGANSVVFDIVGPTDAKAGVRSRPERSFVLGAVRRDALAAARLNARGRSSAIEAFVHAPASQPHLALVFRDERGDKRRRLRRALVAIAAAAFIYSAAELDAAWRVSLDRAIAQVDSERVAAERRVRLAERRIAETGAALQAIEAEPGPLLAEGMASLAMLANRQPAHTEVWRIVMNGRSSTIEGLSHGPEAAELELRRAFEGAAIAFQSQPGEAGSTYAAQINWPHEAGP